MSATGNFDLKEEIRDYWSGRAAGFDAAPGHRIDDADMAAWQRLIGAALGPLDGRAVLDLACGTGEVSRALLGLGAQVTGVDLSEAMLGRARAKLAGQPWQGRLADAEVLAGIPDAGFDGAVTRHLVWTLTEPASAFAAWFRVLKPGARLLVVDGDWVREGLRAKLLRRIAAALGGTAPAAAAAEDAARHRGAAAAAGLACEGRGARQCPGAGGCGPCGVSCRAAGSRSRTQKEGFPPRGGGSRAGFNRPMPPIHSAGDRSASWGYQAPFAAASNTTASTGVVSRPVRSP